MSSSSKRPRSPSPPSVRPAKSHRPAVQGANDFKDFQKDVKDAVNRMLLTGGRKYEKAAIFAINFSHSDLQDVERLRDELLGILQTRYNWIVETYVVDCRLHYGEVQRRLQGAIEQFSQIHSSAGPGRHLLSYYVSGHGYGNSRSELTLCGSLMPNGRPRRPFFLWKDIIAISKRLPTDKNHRLMIMDCCASGLANLEEDDVEVIGASAWESEAHGSVQASFTRVLIDQLKACKGASVTTTQLISSIYSFKTVRQGVSIPIYIRASGDRGPAIIHRIESLHAPQQQMRGHPKHAHVIIAVKIKNENTVPSAEEFAKWLKSDLPSHVGEIDITAKWKIGSVLVLIILPIAIWMDLSPRLAYTFVDWHHEFDANAARIRQEAAITPKWLSQEMPRQPQMRSGNIQQQQQQPGSSGRK